MNIFRYFRYKKLREAHELKVKLWQRLKMKEQNDYYKKLTQQKNEELHQIKVHKKALRHKKNRIYLRQSIHYSNWRY